MPATPRPPRARRVDRHHRPALVSLARSRDTSLVTSHLVTSRRIARVDGVVQGVGFRPFVARLAAAEGLAGLVRNEGALVWIDVEGAPASLASFAARLTREAPPAARIDHVEWEDAPPLGRETFVIDASATGEAALPIPPDLATCAECLAEIRDPRARRRAYPFTNCTACGPRFTIVTGLPYDRPRTTMAAFALCDACRAEYGSPLDRRHHAQPIACPRCGPSLRMLDRDGALLAGPSEALARSVEAIRRGGVVALKGLGGYQLVCGATDEAAVARLRERKRREAKPFAIMARDLASARRIAHLSDADERALASPAAPIVLAKRGASSLAPSVAPGIAKLGVMLPTTPLHHLLLEALDAPIVCTSGNLHEDPIAIDEADALARLAAIADVFLVHDRPIARRADDGVVHVIDGRARTLRLGRGLGPRALPLGGDGKARLCLGAHLKNAPAAAFGGSVVLWPHVGDLDAPLAIAAFREAVDDLTRFFELAPEELVCDLHPDYASSTFAERSPLPVRRVPHHVAHVAACLAEHGRERALGFAWDGFGLGPDGGAWGGEALRLEGAAWSRVAHLAPFALPGGDAAARDGRRALSGVLLAADRLALADRETARFTEVSRSRLAPRTSSAGRLFDAVAALLGVRARSSFEGQAAMELEALAEPGAAPYPFSLEGGVLDWTPMIDPLARDRGDAARASSRFHATLVAMIVAASEGASTVALSGGCFQNARLAEDAIAALRERGVEVLLPELAPPNDGGIALGQAWLASRG